LYLQWRDCYKKTISKYRIKGKLFTMVRLFKYFFYLLVLAGIAFVAFAYVGPMFGFDFSTGVHAIELPLDLDIK